MKKSLLFLWFVILFVFLTINSQAQYKKKVDGEGIKKIISIIASDDYMGRETGTKGCEMVEEYFAKEFEILKLKPAGDNNSYYFNYTIPFYKVEGDVSLVIDNRTFYYGRNEDFRTAYYSDGGNISGEIIFAGYGIFCPDKKRNDFENIDIKNKIVLIRRGCPNNDWEKWEDYAIDSIKAEYCYKNGALGILFFELNQSQQFQMTPAQQIPQPPNSLAQFNQLKNFPIFIIDERVVRFIMENTAQGAMNIQRGMDSKTVSCTTGRTAKMSAKISYDREKKVRDVLAMIPGTDSKLKNEAIIIGGHIDHIGTDLNGKVNNGADDNASGSSVVLGVAQAMVKNKFKPKRTVIFAGWSGEEKGLLGSYAWCKRPAWDLEKVVVYFNLDMVGLGDVKLNMPGIHYAADVWKFIKENTDTSMLNKVNPGKGGPGGSDHTPFLQKGVPAFAGMTAGSHPDYHQPGDDPEKISSEILQFVGDFMYHCIDILANSKKDFITKGRNDSIKFQLANIQNLSPVIYSTYKETLSGKDLDFSLVNLSDKISGENPDQTFITILKNIDEAFKSNNVNKEYAFISNPTEARFLSYQNKSGLIAGMDLNAVNYNDLYCRTLARAGVKIGFINSGAPFAKDSFDKNKILSGIMDAGMAVILNNLPKNEILNLLKQAEKPVAIMSDNIEILNDELIKKIKEKGNLFIYNISSEKSIDQITGDIEKLKSLLDDDSFTFKFSTFDNNVYSKIKHIYKFLDSKNYPGDFIGKIFSNNFTTFLTKALQEKAQRTGIRMF